VTFKDLVSTLSSSIGYRTRLRRFGNQLTLKVDRTKEIGKSDVLLVMCLRNELLRLPYFVDYYRKLGVNHFLIIDNGSTDGLLGWAKEQPDISVWHTEAGYKASNFGMEWCNYLLRTYGTGHLCVTVDPDEFLVYPCMESRNLRELGEFLRSEKRDVFHAVMLDAYSDKPLEETVYSSGDNPWEVAPYFDRDGYVQVATRALTPFTRGGPRMRVHNRRVPAKSPALNKIPVVWWRRHYRYVSSMHDLVPLKAPGPRERANPTPTGALFHFKFFASLQDKASEEMHRKEHYFGGAEYERYISKNREILFEDGVSVRYSSPEQLIELGLMCRGNWL
jgi:hypothetical protein